MSKSKCSFRYHLHGSSAGISPVLTPLLPLGVPVSARVAQGTEPVQTSFPPCLGSHPQELPEPCELDHPCSGRQWRHGRVAMRYVKR